MKLVEVLKKYKQSGEEVNIIPQFEYLADAFVRHLIVESVDSKSGTVEFKRYSDTKDKSRYVKIWMNIDDIAQLYVLNY